MTRYLSSLLLFAAAPLFAATTYQARISLDIRPTSQSIGGAIELKPERGYVREMKLNMPKARYSQIQGDGTVKITGDRVLWQPPLTGGTLRYVVQVNNKRSDGAFDAMINSDWAIFRGDKVVPKAKVRAKGRSISQLFVTVPRGWHVNTGFERTSETQFRFDLTDPNRKFDAPKGWMIAGEIANRAEVIDGCKVIIAGPEGLGLRRQDMLALLNYTLPELKRAFGKLPKQLLIVSGPDPMWRGGLSAPNSLYLHMDRPMISENGTSSLLHELTHSITRIRGADRADWIAEGLAEYYGLMAIHRSGGMSDARLASSKDALRSWSKTVRTLSMQRSTGEVTARAVLLFIELDQEIKATNKTRSIDDVTRLLLKDGARVSVAELRAAASKILGRPSKVLQSELIRD